MAVSGAQPVTTWSGWDPRGRAEAGDPVHDVLDEVPGGSDSDRFELLAVAGRGFRPPQYLTVRTEPTRDGRDAAAEQDAAGAGALRLTWSLEYRQVAETAPRDKAPYAIYLLGVNPPADVTDEELGTFNDFYTNVHLPEVAERRNASRAARFELIREIKAPYQGAPRFLATYETDEAGASNRRHSGPPYSPGPAVWQAHTTPWRLWYRTIST
jgi:hypothetical protein